MKTLALRTASVLALGAFALSASAQNLVTNGSFETGDFTGWTLTSPQDLTFVDTGFASDGVYAAFFGDLLADGGGSFTQTIATVPGATYDFSFDFSGDGDSPSGFAAKFGGTTVFSVTDPALQFDYTTYKFTLTATSASTPLTFTGYDDPFFIELDNVIVSRVVTSTPEPASFAALGVGALALLRRRRRHA